MTISARMETGIAMASAIAGPLPEMMAKAVPKTPPVITSGGIAAPTLYISHKDKFERGPNDSTLDYITKHQANKGA
jgi:hypothetical protein